MRLVLLTSLLVSRHQSSATRANHVAFAQLHRRLFHQRIVSTASRTNSGVRFGIYHTLNSIMTSDAAPRRSARLVKLDPADEADGILSKGNNFGSMKVTELKELLKQNGLSVSGNKADLIDRLTVASIQAPESSDTKPSATSNKRRKISRKVTPDVKEDEAKTPKQQKVSISSSEDVDCLPRTREMLLKSSADGDLMVIGVDEAGRGPLAGPVVAAAAIVPTNIAGVVDSKKITKEEEREQLYEAIIASPGVRYAVAVISAQRIDEINILQATLEGMRMATEAVMKLSENNDIVGKDDNIASAERTEISYVVTGSNSGNSVTTGATTQSKSNSYYALIDGNKIPKDMPCPSESMVKGDGREFAIAAASILAKVTRDKLMHEYDRKYPEYELSRHKGYPTAAHMAIVKRIGASPIHRRTFAPLKHMEFDKDGKIIG